MSKVVLSGFIIVPKQDLKTIKAELAHHIRLTRQEAGCIVFNVIQNEELSTRFDVYEEFVDQQAFEHHQKRIKKSNWGKLTKDVQRSFNIN
ncbi:antibiotic biosynthesis monooxygenase [Endozoicomonas sp. G2_1]|uniref:putative quinol monooxygenase n=1 Tax=Endozoicomonas sp. G2_1 TaxID=2821091 RepID=UPI001ADC4F70|nr:antibiotic biosynthesis monooxygenase [Endozoicomonas sp. G2_1]MBO9489173.1 antibiotic biosynthesis monooxygenase [Endozoicomonas sp. G2_1]